MSLKRFSLPQAILVSALALTTVCGAVSAQVISPTVPRAAKVIDTKVKQHLAAVLSSDEFSREETIRIPVLKKKADEAPSEWRQWLEKFFGWLANLLRAGVWVFGAIAVAVLLVTAHYWWRVYASRARLLPTAVPTHVGGLDIRASSLPDDIGAAAWQRWQQGDQIGCLSLLYRGVLSALVLRFEVRIRASSTESECVRAAAFRLTLDAHRYFVELADTWVRAVYAGRLPLAAQVQTLCERFDVYFLTTATTRDPALALTRSARA